VKEIKIYYTEEQLSTILDALNNAIIALSDAYGAANLGCYESVPRKLRAAFERKSTEEVKAVTSIRMDAIYTLYKDLLAFEEKE